MSHRSIYHWMRMDVKNLDSFHQYQNMIRTHHRHNRKVYYHHGIVKKNKGETESLDSGFKEPNECSSQHTTAQLYDEQNDQLDGKHFAFHNLTTKSCDVSMASIN